MAEIKDSGARTKYNSGALRDLNPENGRMDLLTLIDIADFLKYIDQNISNDIELKLPSLYEYIGNYMETGDKTSIYNIIIQFINKEYNCSIETALLDLSIHYSQCLSKYPERNWEKGISAHSFIDSALRHAMKYFRGDQDEPHNRAFLWNLFGVLWTIRNKPDLNDLPFSKGSNKEKK